MTVAFLNLMVVANALATGGDEGAVRNQVALELQISGLGSDGGEIEIRPGHAGCKFEPIVRKLQKVPAGVVVRADPIPVVAESLGADRDCSFSIVIKEPGKPARKYLRGIRLSPEVAGKPMPRQSLRCYLSTPSMVASGSGDTARR